MRFSALVLGALGLAGLSVGGATAMESGVTACPIPGTLPRPTTAVSCGYNPGNLQPTCRTWVSTVCPSATAVLEKHNPAPVGVAPEVQRDAVPTPPICCFDVKTGTYQCPCNKGSDIEARIPPPEFLSTRGLTLPGEVPTTMATVTKSQEVKANDYCRCYTCPPWGPCRYLPCLCGSAGAEEVQ